MPRGRAKYEKKRKHPKTRHARKVAAARAGPAAAAPTPAKKKPHPGPRRARDFSGRVAPQDDLDDFDEIERAAKGDREVKALFARVGEGRGIRDRLARAVASAAGGLGGPVRPADADAVCERAHALLFVPRDSIRRKTNPRDKAHAALRRQCGFDIVITRKQPKPLRKAIQKLLHAVASVAAVGKVVAVPPELVAALEASARDLTAVIQSTGKARGEKRGLSAELAAAHEALEVWYDDFAVAVNGAYFETDEKTRARRTALLSLIPRERDKKRKRTATTGTPPALAVAAPPD
jgi:hypothetical protein